MKYVFALFASMLCVCGLCEGSDRGTNSTERNIDVADWPTYNLNIAGRSIEVAMPSRPKVKQNGKVLVAISKALQDGERKEYRVIAAKITPCVDDEIFWDKLEEYLPGFRDSQRNYGAGPFYYTNSEPEGPSWGFGTLYYGQRVHAKGEIERIEVLISADFSAGFAVALISPWQKQEDWVGTSDEYTCDPRNQAFFKFFSENN